MHALVLLIAPLIVAGGQAKLVTKDVKVGKGEAAKAGDLLVMEYKGTLTNGKVFDESTGKPPFSFVLGSGQVIEGWDKGIVGMKVGGQRKLTIPPEMGYGAQGAGADIPPNATLNFDVKLLHIWKGGKQDKIIVTNVKPGKGAGAKKGDTVEVHYTGTFMNGFKFDSSEDSGQTFSVEVGSGGVIPGFDQGLVGLKVGGERKIIIPPALGYGEAGAGGGVIPPNATLVFTLKRVK